MAEGGERAAKKKVVSYKALHEGGFSDACSTPIASDRGVSSPHQADISKDFVPPDTDSRSLVTSADDHDSADLDAEIVDLESSIREVQDKLRLSEVKFKKATKIAKKNKMKAELQKASDQLRKAEEQGEELTLKPNLANKASDQLTVRELRNFKELDRSVSKQMSSLGLVSSTSSDSESSDSSVSESEDVEFSESVASRSKSSKRRRKSKMQSGLYKKSSDKVKFAQVWPHSSLQYEFVSENISFKSLDIKMFVAGELEIILSSQISRGEARGRLRFLKKIMYYANIYEWKGLLQFYAAWVRRIELGHSTWNDDPAEIETAMLARYCLPQRTPAAPKHDKYLPKSEQVWWCSDYNQNKCSFKVPEHQKNVKGHMRTVRHFCAKCWRTDNVRLEHPENSTVCPHH